MAYKDEALAWLRRVTEITGKSASELARLADVAPTTLTRPLNNPNYKAAPKFPLLRRIATLTGVPLPDELIVEDDERLNRLPIKPLTVRGIVAAGMWQAINVAQDQPLGMVPMVEDDRYSGYPQWADLIRGPSMNRHYQDGDYVHVVDAKAIGYAAFPDDHVIVERYRKQDGEVERTCKRVARLKGELVLVGDSTDEQWNAPLPFAHPDDDTVTVEIRGLVIGSYRPRRR